MTIAIALRVNNGVVLAADSAATVLYPTDREILSEIYLHAEKVFNLIRGRPIGVVAYGLGSLGPASVATLTKDFRRRIKTAGRGNRWHVDQDNYRMEHVLDLFREFIFEEHYRPLFEGDPDPPDMGFIMAGYSTDAQLPEVWEWNIREGRSGELERPLRGNEAGVVAEGQPEPLRRLLVGFEQRKMRLILEAAGIRPEQIDTALRIALRVLPTKLVTDPMPIQDAVDVAKMLAELAIGYTRYKPGLTTVDGPVDIAAITKYEGFKWVSRKHYYSREHNPVEYRFGGEGDHERDRTSDQ